MRNDSALIETPLQVNTVADVEVNSGLLQPPVKGYESTKKETLLAESLDFGLIQLVSGN
jgi:hypothetical protein